MSNPIIEEENEMMGSDVSVDTSYASPSKNMPRIRNDTLGLNPMNYANQTVEDEVQMEILTS